MSQLRPLPPAPPDHLPEDPAFPRRSRYRRPRRPLSLWGLALGLLLGIAGGLFYAWEVDRVVELDTRPHQLNAEGRTHYVVAVMLNYRMDGDLTRALQELIALELGPDPIQAVADMACDLARTGYVENNSGLSAVRSMMTFYQLQGRTGCADLLVPEVESVQVVVIDVPTPTATLPPPPSKTPLPSEATITPDFVVVPTTVPQRRFQGRIASTFCDTELSGIVEVFVQAVGGAAIPGQRIRVRWDGGEDSFFSGLKPERGPAYADFQMQEGLAYTIDMPGQSDPITTPLMAESCFTEGGQQALRSYRVVFVSGG